MAPAVNWSVCAPRQTSSFVHGCGGTQKSVQGHSQTKGNAVSIERKAVGRAEEVDTRSERRAPAACDDAKQSKAEQRGVARHSRLGDVVVDITVRGGPVVGW